MIRVKPEDTLEIIRYLDLFPGCLEEMLYLFPILDHEFPDGDVVIEMNHDPECYNPYIKMVVLLSEYPDDVMEKIDEISTTQYAKFPRSRGVVLLTTHFKPKE